MDSVDDEAFVAMSKSKVLVTGSINNGCCVYIQSHLLIERQRQTLDHEHQVLHVSIITSINPGKAAPKIIAYIQRVPRSVLFICPDLLKSC